MTSALTRLTENMARDRGSRGRLVLIPFVLARAVWGRIGESSVCLMEFFYFTLPYLFPLFTAAVFLVYMPMEFDLVLQLI
jgi:hypothetical protein